MRNISYCIIISSIVSTILLFFSCSNDIEHIKKVSQLEQVPKLLGENIYFTQSEHGNIVLRVFTKELVQYSNGEKNYTEFPQGIRAVHFTNYPDTVSFLQANYAINYNDTDVWEAKGNVIARNAKNEQLNTEYLQWDQKKKIIYSNTRVQVTTPNDIIYGEGFESDEQFENWTVKKVTGVFTFEE
ncbi:MAG: LPS export ABC transporter periplasmic protein LptC [Bacteroidales bacterium]|jgi:LPS export ABC transporter protein LptC|nr:LPS export ABC transporter periplasmic protein LptC [Bacteroidales bacterium]